VSTGDLSLVADLEISLLSLGELTFVVPVFYDEFIEVRVSTRRRRDKRRIDETLDLLKDGDRLARN
jgi:hypothetical protein